MQKHRDSQKIAYHTEKEKGQKEKMKNNSKGGKWFDLFLRSIDSREEVKMV